MKIEINDLYDLNGLSWKHNFKEYKIYTLVDSFSLCVVTYTKFLNREKTIIIADIKEEDVHELMVFGITIIKSDTYKSWNDRYDSQSKEFKE